ncbi:hypothetical protein ABZ402_51870 [Streptomyces mirabilis]|uniref:hypothetical protein n=1 Tax=Streptomyces mirabilis TaxID=68239 RepID=UPI0033EC080D
MISIYAPVEFAPVRDKARVYYGRNQHQRDTGVKATTEEPARPGRRARCRSPCPASSSAAKLLDKARATLADTTTGPARPSRIEDFRRYLVIFTSDDRIFLVRRVPEEEAERQEQAAAAQRRADQIRGTIRVVAALDAEAARDVAYADELTREWNTKVWQAAHA